jgi:hypothetical protein
MTQSVWVYQSLNLPQLVTSGTTSKLGLMENGSKVHIQNKLQKCAPESSNQGSGINCRNATKTYISRCPRQGTLQHYYKVRGRVRLQFKWVNALKFTEHKMGSEAPQTLCNKRQSSPRYYGKKSQNPFTIVELCHVDRLTERWS